MIDFDLSSLEMRLTTFLFFFFFFFNNRLYFSGQFYVDRKFELKYGVPIHPPLPEPTDSPVTSTLHWRGTSAQVTDVIINGSPWFTLGFTLGAT